MTFSATFSPALAAVAGWTRSITSPTSHCGTIIPPNAGTTFLSVSLMLELPPSRQPPISFHPIEAHAAIPPIFHQRCPRRQTAMALQGRSSVRLRLAGRRGGRGPHHRDGAMVMMLFFFVLSVPFSIAHPLYTVYSFASLLLASNPFHALFNIGLAYTLSFPNLVAL